LKLVPYQQVELSGTHLFCASEPSRLSLLRAGFCSILRVYGDGLSDKASSTPLTPLDLRLVLFVPFPPYQSFSLSLRISRISLIRIATSLMQRILYAYASPPFFHFRILLFRVLFLIDDPATAPTPSCEPTSFYFTTIISGIPPMFLLSRYWVLTLLHQVNHLIPWFPPLQITLRYPVTLPNVSPPPPLRFPRR